SAGVPRRLGKGTPAANASCTSCGIENSIGVPKMPGAIVMLRMPLRARSRAIGSVMPTTPPLLAAYAAWSIWPSKAATLAGGLGLVLAHRLGSEPDHVEAADQVDRHDLGKQLERMRAVLAHRL